MVFKNTFLDMVAKSPFKLLQAHMQESCKAAVKLQAFFEASLAKNWESAKDIMLAISEDESSSDSLKIEVCQNLHNGIFLPVPKGQIISLLMQQDSIANTAEDLAGLVFSRKMDFPNIIHDDLNFFLTSSVNACVKAEKAISELSQVIESGFSGSVQTITESIIDDVNSLESENDKLQRKIRNKVFLIEDELNPLNAMFLYKVLQRIGNLADSAQRVGVQLIMLVTR
ncbi:MAG: TIGR00153 family protein [Pseudomonadota bacterium]|nr:TIGR00153 family protein [Pseudomonadota bacterium]